MITGQIKNKIDAIWDVFYSGGISNPLDVIEQITYLMFIHDLSQYDKTKEANSRFLGVPYTSIFTGPATQYRWDKLTQIHEPKQLFNLMQNQVFPFMKNLNANKNSAFSKYMETALFKIPTPQKLMSVIDSMNELYKLEAEIKDSDIRGDVYEYMLGKLATSGDLGQFRTPRHIIRMMVELLDPTVEDTICDPACGTAGFLVEAGKFIKEKAKTQGVHTQRRFNEHFNRDMFTGYDVDKTMLRIGAMNMMSHGIEEPKIEYRDSLSKDDNKDADQYSIILANPPFKGSITESTIADDLKRITKTTKTELLFLALFLRMLRNGGKAAVIVPDGVLFGSSRAHKSIRQEIVEKHRLEAVISMPSGVFKPYAGVSTAILIFTKTGFGGTDNVWFYDMQADGLSLDDKRQPISENDIPDIINRWKHLPEENVRKRTEKSFFVPKSEIVEKGYDLSINKYKEIVYEKEDLPSPAELMKELEELDAQYEKEIAELKRLLGD